MIKASEIKMDFTQCLIISLFVILIFVKDVRGLSVSITAPDHAELGANPLELSCTYDLVDVGNIFFIGWEREKDTGTEFDRLVTFFPPGGNPPAFTELGNALKNESRFDYTQAPVEGSLTAKIKFTEIKCEDERKYRCTVSWFSLADSTSLTTSEDTDIEVRAQPKTPSDIGISPSETVVENDFVQFTCVSNIGRPAPTNHNNALRWSKFRKNEAEAAITGTTSTVTMNSGTCTYNATSTISIQMGPADNELTVRCTVNNNNDYAQSAQIFVNYQVRTPQLSRIPNQTEYVLGGQLVFDCVTTGNPDPTYMIYHNDSLVKSTSQLRLDSLEDDHAGMYRCVATNSFGGNTFSQNSSVFTLKIVTDRIVTEAQEGPADGGLSKEATIAIAVVVPIVVIVVVIIVIIVVCKSRRNKGEPVEEPSEKPRNNQDLSFVNRPDDKLKNYPFNNQFDNKAKGDLQYADLTFDDRPRSRKPIQLYETDLNSSSSTPYSEVMMPSV